MSITEELVVEEDGKSRKAIVYRMVMNGGHLLCIVLYMNASMILFLVGVIQ